MPEKTQLIILSYSRVKNASKGWEVLEGEQIVPVAELAPILGRSCDSVERKP
jgi:hypothetical protein